MYERSPKLWRSIGGVALENLSAGRGLHAFLRESQVRVFAAMELKALSSRFRCSAGYGGQPSTPGALPSMVVQLRGFMSLARLVIRRASKLGLSRICWPQDALCSMGSVC
jgi:hypothetical protein